MPAISRELLPINWIILYFVYGQVFFVMGLSIALQSRRRSRLKLATSLPWLAGFGLLHGLVEWGYFFIPLQTPYLSPPLVTASHLLQLFLLGLSFCCLFQFGIALTVPTLSQYRWLRAGPGLVFVSWGLGLGLGWGLGLLTVDDVPSLGDIVARYGMALPGALLAGMGLLRQERQMHDMDVPHIAGYLRGAALSFVAYSLVGGLITPAGPFFPASWLNYDRVIAAIGVPVPVFRSLCGLVMAFCIVRSSEVFEVETDRLIAEMDRARALAADRERIGRELHDGIIQSIYAAGLGLDDALHTVPGLPDQAQAKIRMVMEALNNVIQNIRSYIFDLRPSEGERELEAILTELVHELHLDTLLEADLRVSGQPHVTLTPRQVTHLGQIAREALSNVVQHAQAHQVRVALTYGQNEVRLAICDDGVGFAHDEVQSRRGDGQGLGNIRERVGLLGGRFRLDSQIKQGTAVEVRVPYETDLDG